MNEKKNKHMTLQDRTEIQECLYKRMTFKAISALIEKDATTVSKEVKLHAQSHTNSFVTTDKICPKLQKAPFVCNGCKLKGSQACRYPRRIYIAKMAQQAYESMLVEARTGIALNKSEFYENDRIITERMETGQHIYHILHSSDVTVSKSSVYRYFHQGYLSASTIDLPRAVKFKPRDRKHGEYVPKGVKIGRSYDDFLLFMEENSLSEHQEFDTVIGNPGGRVIMTIHFTAANFMFGLLLDNKTAAEASAKIIRLKQTLSDNDFSFGQLFSVILTDNGGEFSDVSAFENDLNGNIETKLFFCDPMQSSQKPFIEKNHTLFRDIIPKGVSFDSFTQETVNLIFSHVNSVKRKIYNGISPCEMFSFLYSASLLSVFGISEIHADNVV
jgi:IS30 family transposase